jgi:hypothetical protein
MTDNWTLYDADRGNARDFDNRSDAEAAKADLESLGVDADIYPPGESPDDDDVTVQTDGGDEVVEPIDAPGEGDVTLPERSVGEDPIEWVPEDFVDVIDGTPAINRKGFEVLAHFYDVSVASDLEEAPEDHDFEYCRVKATATTADGRACEAYGSAHTERGDDPELLLEMADTRARKRALSIATGVGAVAVEELKNEVDR